MSGVAIVCVLGVPEAARRGDAPSRYRIEPGSNPAGRVQARFSGPQLALLEKLNRADVRHLDRLPLLVVPVAWDEDELTHSPLPLRYGPGAASPKLVVAYLPGQVFGAYELGVLVQWGPISSGRRTHRTRPGRFALNWRSAGRASTVDPEWFMRWYFNFDNTEGLAFHAYALPGYPASHGCIRLLERDARWLFDWGQGWTVDDSGIAVVEAGTPVLIVGEYHFDALPPWRSLSWLAHPVPLPTPPVT
jgi:L,D-transpeptidase catalytic domain